jgi:hypothetical protein
MAFPILAPTARDFSPGDWPVKRFESQSGAEIRILYGSQRVGATLSLSYDNITDTEAQQFLTDYTTQLGTFRTFRLPAAVRTGTSVDMDAPPQTRWRYAQPPGVTSVRPGISSVKVSLVAVA